MKAACSLSFEGQSEQSRPFIIDFDSDDPIHAFLHIIHKELQFSTRSIDGKYWAMEDEKECCLEIEHNTHWDDYQMQVLDYHIWINPEK